MALMEMAVNAIALWSFVGASALIKHWYNESKREIMQV